MPHRASDDKTRGQRSCRNRPGSYIFPAPVRHRWIPRGGMVGIWREQGRGGQVYGYADSTDDYLKRMRRVEGQVRRLQRMVDQESTASTS